MKVLFFGATSALALAASLASIGPAPQARAWRTSHFENVLGTSMEIKLSTASETAATKAETAAIDEIKRLNGILSGYDSTSEFSRWAQTRRKAVHVSPELMEILSLWDSWKTRSGGALNPASEALSQVWKSAEAAQTLPADEELRVASTAANQPQWKLDNGSVTATRLTGTPLRLNSFTKSYIVERAAEAALRTQGITGVVVNIGGDLVVRGDTSDLVSVADPRSDAENSDPLAVLNVSDRAVATSGSYRRGFEIGGKHYSHIVNPRTGRTAEEVISATVVAPDDVDAGALATAFCVLAPEESRKLAANVKGVDYMLLRADGGRMVSAGWNAMQAVESRV